MTVQLWKSILHILNYYGTQVQNEQTWGLVNHEMPPSTALARGRGSVFVKWTAEMKERFYEIWVPFLEHNCVFPSNWRREIMIHNGFPCWRCARPCGTWFTTLWHLIRIICLIIPILQLTKRGANALRLFAQSMCLISFGAKMECWCSNFGGSSFDHDNAIVCVCVCVAHGHGRWYGGGLGWTGAGWREVVGEERGHLYYSQQ